MTTWWVWATNPNDALERLFVCEEYRTKEEALRKWPENRQMRLHEVQIRSLSDTEHLTSTNIPPVQAAGV